MTIAQAMLGVLLVLAPAPRQEPEVARPESLTWEALTTQKLDFTRFLPRPNAADTLHDGEYRPDLLPILKAWAQKEFPAEKYYAHADWVRSTGDILAAFKSVRRSEERTEELLENLRKNYPRVYEELTPYLPELVRSWRLYGSDWDPDDDREDDGAYMATQWFVRPDESRVDFWNELEGDREVYQAAAFLYCDFHAIREVTLDYAGYDAHVGRDLEWIRGRKGTYFVNEAGAEPAFSSIVVDMEVDLPFPYSTAELSLRTCDLFDADGHPTGNYYAESEDFHWFAGRDTFIPVHTSDGAFVGTLVVSQAGLDVDGVPDGDGDREAILRASLGNWKRLAEPRYERSGGAPRDEPGRFPPLPARSLPAE